MKTFIVDSFSSQPFKGNPAGVCFLENNLDDNILLNIAKELNFSETAFIQNTSDPNHFKIRYFSPKMEIPLCGHATLAASKVLFERNSSLNNIHFMNIQNLNLHIEKKGKSIKMEFPVYSTTPANAPTKLLNALGIKEIQNAVHNKETNILLLEIESSTLLEELKPDFEALV